MAEEPEKRERATADGGNPAGPCIDLIDEKYRNSGSTVHLYVYNGDAGFLSSTKGHNDARLTGVLRSTPDTDQRGMPAAEWIPPENAAASDSKRSFGLTGLPLRNLI